MDAKERNKGIAHEWIPRLGMFDYICIACGMQSRFNIDPAINNDLEDCNPSDIAYIQARKQHIVDSLIWLKHCLNNVRIQHR